jgi:hypothetical protein
VSVPQKKGGIVSGMVQSVMLSSFIYSGATWFIVLSLRFADRNSHILTLDSKYIPTLADWFFLFIMACIFPKSVTFIMAYIQLTLCLNESSQIWTLWPVITPLDFVKITSQTFGMFGLRNKLFIIYSFLTFFFVWFVERNKLMYHHLISHKLIVSTSTRSKIIPPNLRN